VLDAQLTSSERDLPWWPVPEGSEAFAQNPFYLTLFTWDQWEEVTAPASGKVSTSGHKGEPNRTSFPLG